MEERDNRKESLSQGGKNALDDELISMNIRG